MFFAESDGTLVKGKTLQNTDARALFRGRRFQDENSVPFPARRGDQGDRRGQSFRRFEDGPGFRRSTDDLKRTLSVAAEQDDNESRPLRRSGADYGRGEDSAGHPLYKAAMVLEPRVARIEVVGFEYKAEVDDATQAEKERLYESIQVEQIVLNNYYGQAEFVTGAVSGLRRIRRSTPVRCSDSSQMPRATGRTISWTARTCRQSIWTRRRATRWRTGAAAKRPAHHFFP